MIYLKLLKLFTEELGRDDEDVGFEELIEVV